MVVFVLSGLCLIGACLLLFSRGLKQCLLYGQLALLSATGLVGLHSGAQVGDAVLLMIVCVCMLLILNAVLLMNIRQTEVAPRRLLISKTIFLLLIAYLANRLWTVLPRYFTTWQAHEMVDVPENTLLMVVLMVFTLVVFIGSLTFLRDNQ